MHQGLTRSLAVLCCGLFVITGCSTKETEPEIPANLNDLQAAEPQQEHIDQLKSWIFPPAEAEAARQGFVTRCVEATNGGVYKEAVLPHNLGIIPPGGLTTAQLKASGYQPQPESESAYTPPVNEGNGLAAYAGTIKSGGISVEFLEYSATVPVNGCQAQSYQYIYGSVENGLKAVIIAPSFAQAIAEEVREDEAYTNLQKEWSTCMQGKKYPDFTDVTMASDEAVRINSTERAKLAEADVACRESLEYDTKFSEIEKRYYEAVYQRLEKFSGELISIHETGKQNTEKDKTEPKNTSPVEKPQASESASPTAES